LKIPELALKCIGSVLGGLEVVEKEVGDEGTSKFWESLSVELEPTIKLDPPEISTECWNHLAIVIAVT
jgi:hypothetical protein